MTDKIIILKAELFDLNLQRNAIGEMMNRKVMELNKLLEKEKKDEKPLQ